MDREIKEHFDVVLRNQKVIQQEVVSTRRDLETIVAILRGIEEELRRQRK